MKNCVEDHFFKGLKKFSHIHLIGICGTAMANLAGLLKKKGFKVTGSDRNFHPPMSLMLKKLKISTFKGYKAKNLKPAPDFVIVGNVAQRKFPEVRALLRSKIPFTSLPRILYELFLKSSQCIVVAGTHGKTSTTSLMAWIAYESGLEPGFLIGGVSNNFSYSFQWPKKISKKLYSVRSQKKTNKSFKPPWFVIEGDEYDTAFFDKVPKFNHYNAKHLILTSLEFDHADIYKDLKSLKKVFISLLNKIPDDGWVVANAEDKNVMDVIKKSRLKRVITYGLNQGDYQIKNRKVKVHQEFSVIRLGQKISKIQMNGFGIHNALNTLAAFALANELGWSKRKILQAIKSFVGVESRQEILVKEGEKVFLKGRKAFKTLKLLKNSNQRGKTFSYISPITLIKDFAHHPTSVRVTLEALRESFFDKRIIVVFEPRSSSSRRNVFQKKYISSFKASDIAIIASPYKGSQIQKEIRFSSKQLVEDINKRGALKSQTKKKPKAFFFKSSKLILKFLKAIYKKGDLIVVMSNGPFDYLEHRILEEFKKRI